MFLLYDKIKAQEPILKKFNDDWEYLDNQEYTYKIQYIHHQLPYPKSEVLPADRLFIYKI